MSENPQLPRRGRLAATPIRTVVATAALLLGAAGTAGCGGSDSQATDAGSNGRPDGQSSSPASESSESGPDASSSPPGVVGSPIPASPSATETTPTTATVYFVGDAAGKPKLFGETASVPKEAPLAGAAQALMKGPTDADYRSSYARGALGDVSYDEKTGFRVVLLDASLEQQGSLSKDEARIAVQQLVYTLESVEGVKKAPVTVVADGKPVPLFGIDTSKGVTPAPQLDTRALVNVLSPTDGQTVSGTLTARGEASSFEGSVPWSLKTQAGKVVKQDAAQTNGWERLYPWQVRIDLTGLAPGSYVFTAGTDDPSGGAEGPGPTSDTKTITVN